jgi:hypothetical protein
MRCLQCGEQLALLKKFTDGEFCSADHRTLFFETQQKLIVERLSVSGKRFHRYKKPEMKAEAPAPRVDSGPPFAPFAVGEPCGIYNWTGSPEQFPLVFLSDDLIIVPPEYAYKGRNTRAVRLSPLFPVSHPYPAQWANQSLVPIAPLGLETPAVRVPELRRRTADQAPAETGRLWTRQAQPADSEADDPFAQEPAPLVTTGKAEIPVLRSDSSEADVPAILLSSKLFRPQPRSAMDCATQGPRMPTLQPMEQSARPVGRRTAIPITLRECSPLFVDRGFRMVPRQGVSDPLVSAYEFINCGALPAPGTEWMGPDLPTQTIGDLTPLFLGQAFRMRARGPVEWKEGSKPGAAIAETAQAAQLPTSLPGMPGVLADALAPVFLDHTFRMRPRNGVTDPWVGSYELIFTGKIESLASAAALAALPPGSIGACEPSLVRRFYRLSPKGPALSVDLAASERIPQGETEPLQSSPAKCAIPVDAIGDRQPVRVDQPYRMRPRSAVQQKGITPFEQIATGDPDSLQPTTAKGGIPLSVIGDCKPVWLDRFYRMRPRSAVPAADARAFERISTGGPDALLSSASKASLPADVIGDREPVWLDRFFKMRPRAALPAADATAFERISTGDPDPLLSPASKASLPPDVLGDREPVWLDRFFKMRPRAAFPAADATAFERISTGDPDALLSSASKASLPTDVIGDREPVWLDRFFKMRPRAAFPAADATAFERISTGDPDALLSSASQASLPANVLGDREPIWLDRFFKMRPKSPISAATPSTFEQLPEGEPELLISAAVKNGLPADIIGDLAPVHLNRVYKMRPRAGVPDLQLAQFELLSPCDLTAPLSGVLKNRLPATVASEREPVWIDRFYRMRPKSAVPATDLADFEYVPAGGAEPLLSAACKGGLPADIIAEGALVWLDRFFRPRPKTAVASEDLAAFEQLPAGDADTVVLKARKNSLSPDVIGELEPVQLDRVFRMRPKSAVPAADLAEFEQIAPGGSEPLLSHAALGTVPNGVIGTCEPIAAQRAYKMRPRTALHDTRLLAYESVLPGEAEPLQPELERGTLPRIEAGETAPDFVERLFRGRPRNGVGLETALSMMQMTVAACETRVPPARLGSLPASVLGEVSPQALDKPYKMRPRAGVAGNGFFYRAQVDVEQSPRFMHVVPAMPAGSNGHCAPDLVRDPLRMRPRNPVTGTQQYALMDAGEPVTVRVEALLPSMPAILMRQTRADRQEGPPQRRPPTGPAGSNGSRMRGAIRPHEPQAAPQEPVKEEESVAEPAKMAVAPAPEAWTILEQVESRNLIHPGIPQPIDQTPGFERFTYSAVIGANDAVACDSLLHGKLQAVAMPEDEFFCRLTEAGRMKPAPPWQQPCHITPGPGTVMTPATCFAVVPDRQFARKKGFLRRYAERATHLWVSIPRDLRWAAAGVTVLFGIFLHSTLNRAQTSAELNNMQVASFSGNPLPPLQTVANRDWTRLQADLVGRSAVELHDDFYSGLGAWQGDRDWYKSWSRDRASGVEVGALALYLPSLALGDYELDFWGEIHLKAMNWVFRAADLQNYYAVRLETADSTPLPEINIVRYAVIGGKEGPRTRVRLPLNMAKDAAYHVNLEVREQFFTLSVQGHVVDFWSDDRLKTGGIGFFSGKGELSRIESIQITHQYDALGKLCAYLFPRGIPIEGMRSSR